MVFSAFAGQDTSGSPVYGYICNDTSVIKVVDLASHEVVDEIDVHMPVHAVAVHPGGKKLYVLGKGRAYSVDVITMSAKAIGLGDFPSDLIVDPAGKYVCAISKGNVTRNSPGSFFMIATSTDEVVAETTFNSTPIGLTIDPAGQTAYVSTYGYENITAIDLNAKTRGRVTEIPAIAYMNDLAVSPDGRYIYAVCGFSSDVFTGAEFTPSLLIIDLDNQSASTRLILPSTAAGVAVSNDGELVYVTSNEGCQVYAIDPETLNLVAAVELKDQDDVPFWQYADTAGIAIVPLDLSMAPDGDRLFVTVSGGNVSIIDLTRNVQSGVIDAGGLHAGRVVFGPQIRPIIKPVEPVPASPGPCMVYVLNYYNDSVSVINSTTGLVEHVLGVGSGPDALAINEARGRVYVANQRSDNVSVISMHSHAVTDSIDVGRYPGGIAVNPGGTRVFVSNTLDNSVTVINARTQKPIDTFAAGIFPGPIAIDAAGKYVYVANQLSNNITVADARYYTPLKSIDVPSHPLAISLSPDGSVIYVSCGSNDTDASLAMIDTRTGRLLGTAKMKSVSTGMAISPDGNSVIVTNVDSDSMTIVDADTLKVMKRLSLSGNMSVPGQGNTSLKVRPWGIAYHPDGTCVYIAEERTGNVTVVDIRLNRPVASIHLGTGSMYAAASSNRTGPSRLPGFEVLLSMAGILIAGCLLLRKNSSDQNNFRRR